VPPALAVSVTAVAVLTEETVAVKPALDAPAATVTVAGTVTAELLLARLTANPPVGAAAFNVTVQLSVPVVVIAEFVQVNPASTGTAVPLRPTTVDVPVDELLVNVSDPAAEPAAVGLNFTVRIAVCVGFNVRGKVAPETEKPDPLRASALTVTDADPVEDKTRVCVCGAPTGTLVKLTLAGLTVKTGVDAPRASAKACDTPFAVAVSVTAVVVLTEETVAVNPALNEPAATVTDAGTVTTELLLDRLTANPPVGAAAFSETVQLSVPVAVITEFVQVNPVSTGTAVPLRPTTVEVPVEELLVNASDPVEEPAAVGLNCTVRIADCVGFNVSGKVAPETVKPDPLMASVLIVTDPVPVEESVTVCVCGAPTGTLVKLTLAGLTVRVGTAAPRARANVCDTLFAVAVSVTAVMVLTDAMVAVKPALDEPAGTVTDAGTVTAELLLARPTANPPVGAAAFSVTVQLSVPGPVIDPVVQFNPVSTGTPVPLRLTTVDAPVEELLVKVRDPAAAPAAEGSYATVSVAV
jgi:hypothetical protein